MKVLNNICPMMHLWRLHLWNYKNFFWSSISLQSV